MTFCHWIQDTTHHWLLFSATWTSSAHLVFSYHSYAQPRHKGYRWCPFLSFNILTPEGSSTSPKFCTVFSLKKPFPNADPPSVLCLQRFSHIFTFPSVSLQWPSVFMTVLGLFCLAVTNNSNTNNSGKTKIQQQQKQKHHKKQNQSTKKKYTN